MKHLSTVSSDGTFMLMPLTPVPAPAISIPRRITLMPAVVERFTPLTPEFRMPPGNWRQSISIDLVMVTAPKPPGSRQLILPPAAVLDIAPAKVLHGAVRLHGLTSSPTPETQVRVACAYAGAVANAGINMALAIAIFSRCLVMIASLLGVLARLS